MSEKEVDNFGDKALQALLDASHKLVRERRKADDTLILSQDGKPVEVPAKDVPLPEDNDN